MERVFINPTKIDPFLIEKVVAILNEGGIVALPTETVYSLAGCVSKDKAKDKLYRIKKRPKNKSFTIALDDKKKATELYFSTLPPFGYRLIEDFWPGPLTIIYYSSNNDKVGIRIPAHRIIQEILKKLSEAVYLPSANINGEKEAVSADEVENIFQEGLDLIVDSGKCQYGKSSTILDLTYYPFKVLREGVLPQSRIIEVFAKKRVLFVCMGNSCRSPIAQFLLEKYLLEAKPYLKDRYEIISRGISPLEGLGVSSPMASIFKEEEGLSVGKFRAKKIDRDIILSSDLIFTMEEAQSEYILSLEPSSEGRVFTLGRFLPLDLEKDIPDPIGGSDEFCREVYFLIKKAILELKDWL